MAEERTDFIFEPKGGQNVLRVLREIERLSLSVSKSWERMNSASVSGRAARGGGSGSAQQSVQKQELSVAKERLRIEREISRAKERVSVATERRSQLADEKRILELREGMVARAKAQQAQEAAANRQRLAIEREISRAKERTAIAAQRAVERENTARVKALRDSLVSKAREDQTRVEKLTASYAKLGAIGQAAARQLQAGNTRTAATLANIAKVASVAGAVLRTAMSGAASAAQRLTSSLTAIPRALMRIVSSPLGFLVSGAGIALGLRAVAGASDTYLNVANRIAATNDEAARSTKLLAATQRELFEIANRARSPIEGLAELYGRLSLGAKGARISQAQLLTITEAVGKAAAVGGGSQESIEGALIQLSQIFGAGGAARGIGQELRSLREQTPYLFKTIAEGLGRIGVTARGTTNELESLAEEGKITSAQIAQAILVMADDVEGRFKRITPTIGQAFTVLQNSAIRFIGVFSTETGAGKAFAQTILDVADRLDKSAEKFAERVGTVIEAVRSVYLSGLSGKDLEAARQRLTGITDRVQVALLDTMTIVGKSMLSIMRTSAELFITVLIDGVGRGLRQELSGILSDLSASAQGSEWAKAFNLDKTSRDLSLSILNPSDRLQALYREQAEAERALKRRQLEMQVIKERGADVSATAAMNVLGDYPRYRELSREIEGYNKRIKELSELTRQARFEAKLLDHGLELENLKYQRALIGELQGLWVGFGASIVSAWESVTTEIDQATEAHKKQVPFIETLRGKYESLSATVVKFLTDQKKAASELQSQVASANQYVTDYQESLDSRRSAALGMDSDAAMENVENLLKKRAKLIEKNMGTELGGLPDTLAKSTLARLVELEKQTLQIEAQRKAFNAEQKTITKQLTTAETAYRNQIELTNTKRELGLLTTAEAQREVLRITEAQRHSLEGTLADYEALQASPFLKNAAPLAEEVAAKIGEMRHEIEKLRLEEEKLNPDNFWAGFRSGVNQATDSLSTLRMVGERTGELVTDALGNRAFDALESVAQRTETVSGAFRKMASSILSDLARMIYQVTVFNALQSGISGGSNGGGLGGFIQGLFNFGSKSAHGNAFSAGHLMPFAMGAAFQNGYVVDRPTIFPMARGAGLMGEAGPEVVAPLKRGPDGDLGVTVHGGGGRQQAIMVPVELMDKYQYERRAASHEYEEAALRAVRRNPAAYRSAMGVRAG